MSRENLTDREKILLNSDGIKQIYSKRGHYGGKTRLYVLEGEKKDIKVPDNVHIEITSTATKGTIGKLIDIDFDTRSVYDENNNEVDRIDTYGITYIISIDGRKKPSRISGYHSSVLWDYTGNTQWVRNVNQGPKEELKDPMNKFKQRLKKDDWIIGVGTGYGANKPLMIGKVNRWTNHNVWAKAIDGSEFKLNSIKETFLLPSDDARVESLTMAIAKGWNGR